jgi:peptidoglycan-associated lipoprotein
MTTALLLTASVCLVLTLSCGGKSAKTEQTPAADQEAAQASLPEKASAEDALPAGWQVLVSQDIYFEKGSWSLTPESRQVLREKALWLLANPSVNVVVQGHSDESGSEEFNFALGDRRAGAVKSFLIEAGIEPARMAAVSYGREKPAEIRPGENAKAKNRRVHIVIDRID